MKWFLVVSPQREEKQLKVMRALSMGLPLEHEICVGPPKDAKAPFIACGQLWTPEKIVPAAMEDGRPFFLIDNGYYKQSGKLGGPGAAETGHYEFTYRSPAPIVMKEPDFTRHADALKPWCDKRGANVLIGHPGPSFGKPFGMDMAKWSAGIKAEVMAVTKRPIIERTKWTQRPLEDDLKAAHVVVTHSSHIAVDAVRRGIPAIVAPTNPCAPVCSTSLADIEALPMPERGHWWASLMSQQFTLAEMRSGLAWQFLAKIMGQVDGLRAA